MTYDPLKERYIVLLKKREADPESLSDGEWDELKEYSPILEAQIYYTFKNLYLPLFQSYVEGKMELYDFYSRFDDLCWDAFRIWEENIDNPVKLADLNLEVQLVSKMDEFYDLIVEIWWHYESPYLQKVIRSENDPNYKPNFDNISNLIHQKYEEIQKCLS